jgi:hypothetical protein
MSELPVREWLRDQVRVETMKGAKQKPNKLVRWLGVWVNVALIPYVWLWFPREAGHYTRKTLEALIGR